MTSRGAPGHARDDHRDLATRAAVTTVGIAARHCGAPQAVDRHSHIAMQRADQAASPEPDDASDA
jgi:hypothetical protein